MYIYSIYKATCNITNKSYIGFDSNWPTRLNNHKNLHFKDKRNSKFYNAIKKYGWDSFEWSLIYQCKEEVLPKKSHTLNVMESYFISEYDTFRNGYNSTPGGDGKRKGSTESEISKKKKSLSHLGKKLSKETIRKIIESRKGYRHSPETILKLSVAKMGKKAHNKGIRSVRCCCLICHKEVDRGNLGRHHKHLPNLIKD